MNYKVLGISVAVTGAIIAISLVEANRPSKRLELPAKAVSTVAMDMAPSRSSSYQAPPERVERLATPSLSEPPVMTPPIGKIAPETLDAPVSMPQIAYRFGYTFEVAGTNVKSLQERHADRCEALGPRKCRILSMDQSEDANSSNGTLQLAVAANLARSFGKELTTAAQGADAELVASSIDGDDLSKDIVDTEARLRARSLLRDRLMDVLRNRKGTVQELVDAERGVAQVNEEIDQARSWLAEMKSRVQYSRLDIDYRSGAPQTDGFSAPVKDAWSSVGESLGSMVAALIRLLTLLGPLALLCWLIVKLWRMAGLPNPFKPIVDSAVAELKPEKG